MEFLALGRVGTVFEGVLIAWRCTASLCSTVHTAPGYALHSGCHAGRPFPGLCTAAQALQHAISASSVLPAHARFARGFGAGRSFGSGVTLETRLRAGPLASAASVCFGFRGLAVFGALVSSEPSVA